MGMRKQNLWLSTCPPRRSRASELIDKPIPAHLYEFPLGILVRVREARNQPYSGVPNFEVVIILKANTITIEEVHVIVGES